MSEQQFNFSITMKNTGNTTWTDADNYHIGSQNPQDNTDWVINRCALPNDVAPGEQVTITGTATAPSNVGSFNFQWKMVQDGVEWFGDTTHNVLINVIEPNNNAQFISQSIPTNIAPGQSFSSTVVFKNTGNTTWSSGNNYFLGTQAPQDNTTWIGTNRVDLPNDVAPGEQVTFNLTLTAPITEGMYVIQWRMLQNGVEWFGDFSEAVYFPISNIVDTLLTNGNQFSVSNHIVATSFFGWYGEGEWQLDGPWIPVNGRSSWNGSIDYWKTMIKEVMDANIDVMYIELIPVMQQSRGNLFIALNQLRADGWRVPKICPFLDPEITYSLLGFNADCSTETGKDELISHYIEFYKEYYATNTDQYADDYIYTQDGHPVLNIWHIQLHIDNYDQLTRNDVTSRLSAEFGSEHAIFNNDIKMINNAYSPCFNFCDERIYQFEMQEYKIDKDWNGINSSLLKPGYWDQNVRNPGYQLLRDGGSHYTTAWGQVNSDATIDRVYIESFNEYDEGSGIYAAKTDTVYKKTTDGMNNTGDDVWSSNNDPFEYIKTTALGAAQFNDDEQLNAKILWNNIPSTMNPNETFVATVVVRNEGNEQWNEANNFKFGEMEFADPTLFGPTRYLMNDTLDEIPIYGGIFRGRTKTFNITVTAPATPGNYITHWGMLQEGVTWFGDTLEVPIIVEANTGLNKIDNNIFEIYPDPAHDFIVIASEERVWHSAENIQILDITGKVVSTFEKSNTCQKLDVSNLQKAVYFIKIGNSVKKFIKE